MGALRRILAGAVVCVMLGALAAWQVPPWLDWARYRARIEYFATVALGRPVTIGGQVQLSLLPRVVLTAGDVVLADRGDGVSARLHALRLQVAFWPLLAGHVKPLDLVLDDPVISVPWPLPVEAGVAPALARGFAASAEHAELRLGGVVVSGITASLEADPDTGAFSAKGVASLAGRPYRFTALLGEAGADGVALVTVALDGQEKLAGTGGSFRGRLMPHGALAGTLQARGPDLSAIMPGPAAAWQVSGPVKEEGGTVQAPALQLLLGGSTGQASATLQAAAPARLNATVKLGQIALGPWLAAAVQAPGAPRIKLDLQAQAANWHGLTLRDVAATLDTTGAPAMVSAAATLPGRGALHFSARRKAATEGAGWSGPLAVSAPDLPASLGALRALLPAIPPPPPWLPGSAELHGTVKIAPAAAGLSDLALKIGGTTITGDVALLQGPRPHLNAKLAADRLALGGPADWPARALKLAQGAAAGPAAKAIAALETDLDLQVGSLTIPGLELTHAWLQARGGAAGIVIKQAQADAPGLHANLTGTVGLDGVLADASLDVSGAEAAALPAAWRTPPGLFQGPFHVALKAAGPPNRVAAEVRADLGDLRAEAEAHIDLATPHLTATLTLRHPGAPRLLEALGIPGAQRSLGFGSVAVQAHVLLQPGLLEAPDFTVDAAALRAGGAATLDWSGPVPRFNARITAPSLPLPRPATPLPANWLPPAAGILASWSGQADVQAAQILWGADPVATQAEFHLLATGGVVSATLARAGFAGGGASGQAVLDSSGATPHLLLRASLQGAVPGLLPFQPGVDIGGGAFDAAADLEASGHAQPALLATLSGTANAQLRDVAWAGIDLPRIATLLTAKDPHLKADLAAAMASGSTGPLTGTLQATVQNGALLLQPGQLAGPAGALTVTGAVDFPARTSDISVRAVPALPNAPVLGLRLIGPWQGPKHALDIKAALLWAGAVTKGPRK